MQDVGYMGPQLLSKYFDKHARALGIPKDASILDVAAGTGLQGVILKEKYGYMRLDATDASQAMLDKARDTGVYRNFYCCRIGGGYKLPMADNTYDSAVMAGGLAEGHIKCDAFLELIRVVKPGGLIVNAMREVNIRKYEEYHNLHPSFKKWAEEKKWECIEHVIPPIKHYMNLDGLVHVYRVL
ncbi:hypothetical protein NP493_2894g00004 [Ridgeia piscesae]|uniref:Methyltransferase domain-containing protein n=1 Tax=Ridgeia piscesae TaxID=27915 RepID=A0AAD9JBQ7_RIDPI|nr:hypothetical protein NP493_2894g00004 [Ridgeia piscesae]